MLFPFCCVVFCFVCSRACIVGEREREILSYYLFFFYYAIISM
jgi:hypothetical protein